MAITWRVPVSIAIAAFARASPTDTITTTLSTPATCKSIPGDRDWPTASEWAEFNKTISGHLISSIPLASVCHDQDFYNYDASACSTLQTIWDRADETHISAPSDVFSQVFQNYSCVPFTPRSQDCELGNYPSYVVNVTGLTDVQEALAFATEHNLRIVVKNTGHDYMGKSTGKGALSLWTYNLQSVEYLPSYTSTYYQGPAAKLGAGVQAWQTLLLGRDTGHRIVAGTCPTVGVTGGYSQGGGHGILGSSYGVGADNVLEWEVVTANGSHLTATPEQNRDLYWALTGGGGGIFGVVLSSVVRLHPDGIVGRTFLSFNDSTVGNDAYWDAVGAFHALLPDYLDGGNSFSYSVGQSELVAYGTMPDANLTEVNELLRPFLDDLASRGITPSNEPKVADTYYDHFYGYFGPAPYGNCPYYPFTNSRIIPRSLITDPETNAGVTNLFRNISSFEAFSPFYCDSFNVSYQAHPDNSLIQAWRDGMLLCAPAGKWDWSASPEEMMARDTFAAYTLQPMMDEATPGGSTYLNEVNHLYVDWKSQIYAENYEKLLAIKQTYDPDSLFYAVTGVGSDFYAEDTNGRLCLRV